MPNRKILTVGFELASSTCEYASFQSTMSLLDWDIVLFRPEIRGVFSLHGASYQGRPFLSDDSSFQLKECCEHWRREIRQATEAGKTVLVFLSALEEVYIDTGERSYSGTGRNQKTTRLVVSYNNYQSIPVSMKPVVASGNSMKLSHRGAENIATYWDEFQSISSFKVILEGESIPASIVTRSGEKPVGAIYRSKGSPGTLVLLPDIDFYPEDFTKIEEDEDKDVWTKTAEQFATRMVKTIVSLDKALRTSSEITPEPEWASHAEFVLGSERNLRIQLLKAEKEVQEAQGKMEAVLDELRATRRLRGLLFEKGRPLENAIIEALRILGFKAEPFLDGESEFDVVFECEEGRLIGEAEGKDGKAINVEKLRQLAMNVHEDLRRAEVTSLAKPVLFGNAFRLRPLTERGEPFTAKCNSAADASSTALVFTPDLFAPAQYLADQPDEVYAKSCREKLLCTTGRVSFPLPPKEPESKILHTSTKAS